MKVSVCWFRRDLRLEDNAALYHALKSEHPVVPVFIFDTNILDELEEKSDARVQFIHDVLSDMNEQLHEYGSAMQVYHDTPIKAFRQIVKDYEVATVYTNRDYEPYATQRDQEIEAFLKKEEIGFKTFKDQVIFEKEEVVKDNKEPYTVYTPFSKKWLSELKDFHLKAYPTLKYKKNFHAAKSSRIPALSTLGFKPSEVRIPPRVVHKDIIKTYDRTRDTPSIEGTTRLGIHLRFGTLSVRKLATIAKELNGTYLK
ncbi:MAG: deoxyribodipyrimidine photo-lyase, partial [Sphingobacteriales bacterium]